MQFYEQILATKFPIDTSFPGMPMAMLPHAEPGVGGSLIEFEQARPHADRVRIYLDAGDDLQPILDRVASAGGACVFGPLTLPNNIGTIALFTDSEGNRVGLHQPA